MLYDSDCSGDMEIILDSGADISVLPLGWEGCGTEGPLALHVAGRPLGHQSSREAGSVLVRPRSGLLQQPCLHAPEGR